MRVGSFVSEGLVERKARLGSDPDQVVSVPRSRLAGEAGDLLRDHLLDLDHRQARQRLNSMAILRDRMTEHRGGRQRWLDTLLAARCRAAGGSRLTTADWRAVDVFSAFEVVRVGGDR